MTNGNCTNETHPGDGNCGNPDEGQKQQHFFYTPPALKFKSASQMRPIHLHKPSAGQQCTALGNRGKKSGTNQN